WTLPYLQVLIRLFLHRLELLYEKNQGELLLRPIFAFQHKPFLPLQIRSRLRSEDHTSELQSRFELVCSLLLEKKNETLRRRLRRGGTDGRIAAIAARV